MSSHRPHHDVVRNAFNRLTSEADARIDSRREFFRRGAAALLVSHPLLSAFEHGIPGRAPAVRLTLKTQAQYQSEAAQFESAMQSFASAVAMPATNAAQIGAITGQVGIAAAKIELYNSWLVAACAADAALGSWVRKEIRDKATFDKFVDEVMRNAKSVDAIPGIERLRAQLRQMKAQKVATQQQLLAKLQAIAGKQVSATEATRRAQEASECVETWAIVTGALVIVVVAVVAASASFGTATSVSAAAAITVAMVAAAAAALAARYAGTGAERVEQDLKAATEAYQQCLVAASTKPQSQQSQAIADCQAQYMAAQMAAIV